MSVFQSFISDKYGNNLLYSKIMEHYKDIIDIKTGMLHSQQGEPSFGNNDGTFEHIPSTYIESFLRRIHSLNPGANFLDIGSGLGNVVMLANALGYKAKGIEINEDLKRYNSGLDIIWGNVFSNTSIFKGIDVIYMYRPLVDTWEMDKLLKHIYYNSDYNVLIYYKFCHGIDPTADMGMKDTSGFYHHTSFNEYTFMFKNRSYFEKLYNIGLIDGSRFKDNRPKGYKLN